MSKTMVQIKSELAALESLPQGPERWKKQLDLESAAADTPEYDAYYKSVVAEGVLRYGDNTKGFWEGFSYEHEFLEEHTLEECIDDQVDAMN
jgi:hypothetical protein